MKDTDVFHIRDATPLDTEVVCKFVFDTLRSYGIEPDPDRLDADISAFGTRNLPNIKEIAAEINGRAVGIAVLNIRGKTCGMLTAFYVEAAYRNRGIGRALLKTVIETGTMLKLTSLELETRTIFRQAVHLYESTGWRRGPDLPAGYGPDRTYILEL